MSPEFSAVVDPGSGHLLVCGQVDLSTAAAFRSALAEAAVSTQSLTVDLTDVTFLGSAGVAALFDQIDGGLEILLAADSIAATVVDICGLALVARVRSDPTPDLA